MERLAFAARIREGQKDKLRTLLGKEWKEITSLLDELNVTNFSIWNAADMVFVYGEAPDGFAVSGAQMEAAKKLAGSFDAALEWLCGPGERMRLMYEDFGIVRTDKSLIRHRMFMTKLKDGCAEEYKHRHDGLIAARGGVPDPGPDSNFSIWSDGTYIFGYDEIDTTMETEETPEAHENTVAWETRQLGIMDWITDDVDWLTGEKHARSIRLAWH